MPLIPIENISTVPISFLVTADDNECTLDRAKEARDLIGEDIVTHFEIFEGDHGFFVSENSDWFIETVIG